MRVSLDSQADILSSKMLVTFPVFSGDECEDVREFISNFARAGKLNGWNEDNLALGLPLCLKGHASKWLKTLENPDGMKFDELSAALISHFAYGASVWRIKQALNQRRQLENEPVAVFLYSIRSYCVQLNLPRSEWMHYLGMIRTEFEQLMKNMSPKTNSSFRRSTGPGFQTRKDQYHRGIPTCSELRKKGHTYSFCRLQSDMRIPCCNCNRQYSSFSTRRGQNSFYWNTEQGNGLVPLSLVEIMA